MNSHAPKNETTVFNNIVKTLTLMLIFFILSLKKSLNKQNIIANSKVIKKQITNNCFFNNKSSFFLIYKIMLIMFCQTLIKKEAIQSYIF